MNDRASTRTPAPARKACRLKERLARLALPVLLALWPFGTTAGPVDIAGERIAGQMLKAALEAARAEDPARARRLVADAPVPLARDIVEWYLLRSGEGDWAAYRAFLSRHPNWPGVAVIRRKSEAALPDDTAPAEVIRLFAGRPPQTGIGVIRLARALHVSGQKERARAVVIRGWKTLSLSAGEEEVILRRYGNVLGPYHRERTDMLLWRGLVGEAERMLPRLDPAHAALARARIGLQRMVRGVDGLIAAVPSALRDDPGLAYDRFRWRVRKGRDEDALALLRRQSRSAAALGHPGKWADRRRAYARQAMREGKARLAYELASRHFLGAGSDYADLEWLSGYIALRHLKDPERALVHFTRFRDAVVTPISLGRAHYWIAEAEAARGNRVAARISLENAATYQTSFYGQLAAEKLGLPLDSRLATRGRLPDWRAADFVSDPLFVAARLLDRAGEERLMRWFMLTLAVQRKADDIARLADYALENDREYVALLLAKQAARRRIILPEAYFPEPRLPWHRLAVPRHVALAIARRESEFDRAARSRAGALGLMQLMPRTARKMTRALGMPFSTRRLTEDPHYNIRLGGAYLAELLRKYDNAWALAFAAYNAGPSRADRWIARHGDPRSGKIDVVDWIEHIPFRETRNYVMRVSEAATIYRARESGDPRLSLGRDLVGH